MDQGPVAAIPDCEQCHSKPAMVSLSVIVIPPIPDVFSWQPFSIRLYSVHDAAHPPSVDKANKSPRLPSHACESHGEEGDGEFSCPFYFPPPFETFSHSFFFQLNCYPGRHAGHHLSVDKANKSPSLPSPTRVPHGEGSDGEFLLSFLVSLPPFNTFSHSFHFQFNCDPIGCAGCPPSVNHGNKVPPPPSLPLFSWLSQLPSLSQSSEQGPATIISSHEVC